MILVTGGAGFIGSNIVHHFVKQGYEVAVCDVLGTDNKWQNLRKSPPAMIIEPEDLVKVLSNTKKLGAIIHMGAISSTVETDADLIWRTNVTLSQYLWEWCASSRVPFIYASSAATYGDGSLGFDDRDDEEYLEKLAPLNAYGWSKHAFDLWALSHDRAGSRLRPPFWAGLKFFNVYGPNEYHKGGQMSLVPQVVKQINENGSCKLFKSHHPDYADGGQLRDFVSVEECVSVIDWIMNSQTNARLLNVGTGQARSFADLARAVFAAQGIAENIEYVDMPEKLRGQYQYYTQANMNKAFQLGYGKPHIALEDGVRDYVQNYLMKADIYK